MIERKIIIGLITSTTYCERIKDIWNIQLIESDVAKLLSGWIWEYYDRYKKAPGKDIETIYYTKIRSSRISKDIAEEIEQDILPSLSEEYEEQEIELQPLIDETEKYLSEQHLKVFTDNVQALIAKGQLKEAEKLTREFKPLESTTEKLNEFVLTAKQIREQERPHVVTLMSPWLKEGQTTIIYGNYGTGKSLLTISIAYVMGLSEEDCTEENAEIGKWQVKHPTGCLYVDGELGEQEMEERIAQFAWIGRQKYPLRVLSIPEYQLKTEDCFYLSERKNQLKVVKWLTDHPRYKLVVLDSASTLFGLEDENNNSEWNAKINPLLRDLRALGVACLLLHHSGKDGRRGFRGASAAGAMAHNIFCIDNHPDKNIDQGEAWFTISKDKQRARGFSFKKFALKYTQENDDHETHWEVTEND